MKRNLLALLLLSVMLMSACLLCASCDGGGDDDGDEPTNKRELLFDGENYTIFGKTANNNFDVIYAVGETSTMAEVAVGLCNKMVDAGFPKPRNSADTDKDESILEFLIGDTNRALSAEAKAIVEENYDPDTNDMHWVWLCRDGQIALYANSIEAYEKALAEFDEKFFTDGGYKMKKGLEEIGYVKGPHAAYMEYDVPANFFDGYTDPFGMKNSDYKEMTVQRAGASTYRISYKDKSGGTFSADFVQKAWGMWMMGAMSYTTKGGKVHTITDSSTDYEFVLTCKGESYYDWRSGNHGNYPGRDREIYYYEDDTSLQNDILLDMTFYDGKSGEKIVLDTVGDSIKVNGLRVVVHHNIYEMNYKKEHVLFNSERSYLYNGCDVMFDAQLRATQDVHFSTANYSAMMPIAKEYGNCAMFYCVDGSTVFMKTPMSNTQNDAVWGANATKIDFWGENNPKYHITISINNPEDQLRDSVEGRTDKGYAGFREMLGSTSNKFYCSFLSTGGTLEWGEELHFNTTYSFSIQDDFVNPDREPDYWVGVIK